MTDWWAVGIGLGGIAAAVGAWGAAFRANGRADTANEQAREANRYAREANDLAEKANRIAAEALRDAKDGLAIQVGQIHAECRPVPPTEIVAIRQDRIWVGRITVGRNYRVKAVRNYRGTGQVSDPVMLDLVLHANREYEFQIEEYNGDRLRPQLVTESISFRFWPPLDGDGVEVWSCPCGRPRGDEGVTDPGHWSWTVTVTPPPVVRSRYLM